jgi:hypothetical protein
LIANITDKTYNKKKSKSDKSLVLYSNKPENNKKNKSKKKSNSKYKYYSHPSPKHKQKNYLNTNLKKQKKIGEKIQQEITKIGNFQEITQVQE